MTRPDAGGARAASGTWAVALVTVTVAAVLGLWLFLLRLQEYPLSVTGGPDGLVVTAPRDGPYVVTHLIAFPGGEFRGASAALKEPVALTESGATLTITRAEMRKLRWRDRMTSEPVPYPATAARFRVVYTKSPWVEPSPTP